MLTPRRQTINSDSHPRHSLSDIIGGIVSFVMISSKWFFSLCFSGRPPNIHSFHLTITTPPVDLSTFQRLLPTWAFMSIKSFCINCLWSKIFSIYFLAFLPLYFTYQNTPVDYAFGKRNEPFVLGSSNCFSKQRLLSIQLTKKCKLVHIINKVIMQQQAVFQYKDIKIMYICTRIMSKYKYCLKYWDNV